MTKNRVWLITGASRGMGVEFVRAALQNGDHVIATGRNIERLNNSFKDLKNETNLIIHKLDVTKPSDSEEVVQIALNEFGSIDMLLNNAGNFYGGFFEELTPQQFEKQMDTNFYGPMNVTRAVLPVMRKNRAGHIISISSLAGLAGFEYNTAYSSSKFALEGWMEALSQDVAPFSINTTIVEPGFFRTNFLETDAKFLAEPSINDYSDRNKQYREFWKEKNGTQEGDPVKLAKGLISIVNQENPPSRWIAGADAIGGAEEKVRSLQEQINANRELSTSLSFDE